jgi:hypothetical protein
MTSRANRAAPGWRTFVLGGASSIPLVFGGAIYLLWRDTSLLMFRWLEEIRLSQLILSARNSSAIQSIRLPEWVLYSLPNALWVLALVSAAGLLWRDTKRTWLTIAVVNAACLGVGGEVAQGFDLLPGTFSMTDFVLAAFGAAAGGVVSFLGESYAS